MDDNSKSSVDDDELNQMIANLKSKQPDVPAPPMPQTPAAPVATPVLNDDAVASVPPVEVTGPIPVEAVAAPPAPAPMPDPTPVAPAPVVPEPIVQPAQPAATNPNLDSIKQDAIAELRPLVDKLNLSPEDRFNTILLIIRSTDDISLLPAVHAAAKQIPDDGRRAQALLDVIKEIDFFRQ